MYYPAAKSNHHSIKGGLLYHITTMLKLAENICGIYDFLNRDLVYAGVILHDMAKIKEMSSNEMGIVDEYTLEGTLLGHITQGIKEIEVIGKEVNADSKIIMLLQHMVLSHHYEPEYGSPVKPLIPEAEMLHYLDVMDARMYDMKKAIKETKENEFSERIWSLDSRRIYNHGMYEKNKNYMNVIKGKIFEIKSKTGRRPNPFFRKSQIQNTSKSKCRRNRNWHRFCRCTG